MGAAAGLEQPRAPGPTRALPRALAALARVKVRGRCVSGGRRLGGGTQQRSGLVCGQETWSGCGQPVWPCCFCSWCPPGWEEVWGPAGAARPPRSPGGVGLRRARCTSPVLDCGSCSEGAAGACPHCRVSFWMPPCPPKAPFAPQTAHCSAASLGRRGYVSRGCSAPSWPRAGLKPPRQLWGNTEVLEPPRGRKSRSPLQDPGLGPCWLEKAASCVSSWALLVLALFCFSLPSV